MFTFQNFPIIIIVALIVISYLSFFSAVPWGSLF